VQTTQIAPTILKALGLNPNALEAVKQEKTVVLPALFDGLESAARNSQARTRTGQERSVAGLP
jgi:hypothetical protein